MRYSYLIVGVGFTGAVIAREIAEKSNEPVLVIDRRNHISGNAFDRNDQSGILIHDYGPHIFHTNSKMVWDFLSQFTEWIPYEHRVLGHVNNKLVPIPFNFTSIEALFSSKEADKLKTHLLGEHGDEVKVPILKLMESENGFVKELADYVYNNIFFNYTKKMWGLEPQELDPQVLSRVPIQIGYDNRYFNDTYQAMPKKGYTKMFEDILNHPNIEVKLNTHFKDISNPNDFKKIIYTGPIDEYFDFRHGELPYRSIRFDFSTHDTEYLQKVGTMNFPGFEFQHTRMTEFKHLTFQKNAKTTICSEYPEAYNSKKNLPYYPIPTPANRNLLNRYKADAIKIKDRIAFVGRLANYQYFNMDQAVARGLQFFQHEIC
jgi:UDP-galactopyranose mutase